MTSPLRDETLLEQVQSGSLPTHVAIIMDGNGRWATARGLARLSGHRAGVEALDDILDLIKQLQIPYLTVYAFSTENWKRKKDEVDGLMRLLIEFINRKSDKLIEADVCFQVIGDRTRLPEDVCLKVRTLEEKTAENTSVYFNIALNYGARQEIIQATKKIAILVKNGQLEPEQIDEQIFSNALYTAGQPDPDLLIRSSGEFRLSNFLLWQIAYTEIWMTNILWPDFTQNDLLNALIDYQKRDRRFGGLHKELNK